MSAFISREKELLKLNEEIDKKAQLGTGRMATSRMLTPRNAKASNSRRATIEVDKINVKGSSRISSPPKNSSLPRPTLKKDLRNSPDHKIGSTSFRLSRGENSSIISDRKVHSPSKIPSPKNGNKCFEPKRIERPPFKSKVNNTKANTVPRNHKNVSAKEKVLLEINSKLDKEAHKILEDSHESNNRPSSKASKSPGKSNKSPPSSAGKQNTNRKSSLSTPKEFSHVITETYRNQNFTESPSTEALQCKENHEDLKTFPIQNETKKSSCEIATSSNKKSKQTPAPSPKINKRTVSTEGLIKFLKSKLSILETELEDNMALLKKRSDELHASRDKQKKLENQRDQAISKNNNLTEQISKLEDKLLSVEQKLKDRENEHSVNLREIETQRRENRVISQANSNLEKRLYKANEELENMKNTVSSMKEAEREKNESWRIERQSQEKQIKALKKQRSELLNAYKKQLYLSDNLRRQNICMEQSRLISFGEKEFTKVLEWNTNN